MGAEHTGDDHVRVHRFDKEVADGARMLLPNLVEELRSGERPGAQIDENDVKLALVEITQGVLFALAEVDLPSRGEGGKGSFCRLKVTGLIRHDQNALTVTHFQELSGDATFTPDEERRRDLRGKRPMSRRFWKQYVLAERGLQF